MEKREQNQESVADSDWSEIQSRRVWTAWVGFHLLANSKPGTKNWLASDIAAIILGQITMSEGQELQGAAMRCTTECYGQLRTRLKNQNGKQTVTKQTHVLQVPGTNLCPRIPPKLLLSDSCYSVNYCLFLTRSCGEKVVGGWPEQT